MSGTPHFEFPEPLVFLEFFGVEPTETGERCWLYERRDESGNTLRFSFDAFERSVQTDLIAATGTRCVTSHELASRIEIGGDELRVSFDRRGATTRLRLRVSPTIEVAWSTLRDE